MMKKILIIGTIASSMLFAKGNNMTSCQEMNMGQDKNCCQISNLTEAQQKDLADLKAQHQKAIAPLIFDKQAKELAIKKELLADKPNWSNIESLIKDKDSIESKIELQMLKNKVEIKEKFGIDFGFNHDKGQGSEKEHNEGFKK